MAYKYLFMLNGVEIEDVSIGSEILEKFEEPLDEGGIELPLTIQNYEYEMRGTLEITIEDDDKTQINFLLLIAYDKVSEGSKYGEWIHDLLVVEYPKKYDDYMIHSLSKTRPIINKGRAPFEIIPNAFNFNALLGPSIATIRAWLKPIEVFNTYFEGENVVFPQVREAYEVTTVASGWGDFVLRPVFIQTNAFGDVVGSRQTLSNNSITWQFPKGNWYIEYGFYSQALNYVVIYKYYIKVIDKTDFSCLELLNSIRKSISKFGGIESKRHFDYTRLFNIEPQLEPFLASVEIPQTFIQKATVRQVINSVFLYINSISRFYRDKDNNVDILTFRNFNEITGSFEMGNLVGYGSQQDASKLYNVGVNWLERALPSNLDESTMTTPASNTSKTVRSQNIQIRQDNFELKLEAPIYEPQKFTYIQSLIELNTTTTPTSQTVSFTEVPIDLTARLINEDEWRLKLITNNFPDVTTVMKTYWDYDLGLRENKVSNLGWRQNDTSINLSRIFGEVVEENIIFNVIKEAIFEHYMLNLPDPIFKVDDSSKISAGLQIGFTLPSFRALRFNLEYTTMENINTEVEREDLSFSQYYSQGKINQHDKLVNIARVSRKSYGDIQRSGVPTRSFKKYAEKLSDLYELGTMDSDGYIIIERKLLLNNEYILADYTATKDHNRLSEFIGLDQLYRAFEIPTSQQVFERIETYKDYLIVTKPNVDNNDVPYVLGMLQPSTPNDFPKLHTISGQGRTAINIIFGTIFNNVTQLGQNTKVTGAFVRTDGFLENYPDGTYKYGILTPVRSFGIKGGFSFTFGFSNNQVAGDSSELLTTNYYNKAIRYTNDSGRFNTLWFQLIKNFMVDVGDDDYTLTQRADNLPLVRTKQTSFFGEESEMVYRCGSFSQINPSHDPLMIEKDSSQAIKISYQNSIIAYEYLSYVFGQAFFSENFIVKNPKVVYNQVVGTKMYLYIYTNKTRYGKFDDLKIKSGHLVTKYELTNSNCTLDSLGRFRFTSTTIIGILGDGVNPTQDNTWAIGDEIGNLYIACNSNVNGFNVFARHLRPNIKEIGTY